jgi:hypothetical protein
MITFSSTAKQGNNYGVLPEREFRFSSVSENRVISARFVPYNNNSFSANATNVVGSVSFESVVNRSIFLKYSNNTFSANVYSIRPTGTVINWNYSRVEENRSDKLLKDRPFPIHGDDQQTSSSLLFYWG